MQARIYLKQLSALNFKIEQKRKEAGELRTLALSVGSPSTEGDRVSSLSGGCSKQHSALERFIDLEKEINEKIDEYVNLKHKIIDEIHKLEDVRYIALLSMHYIPDRRMRTKKLEDIAEIMKKSNGEEYSYDHIRRLHGEALRAFEVRVLNEEGE